MTEQSEFKILKLKQLRKESLRSSFSVPKWTTSGKVTNVIGTIIEAHLPEAKIGMICEIDVGSKSGEPVLAEVVGFKESRTQMMPFSDISGICPGCPVTAKTIVDEVLVGDHLLGKVINPMGEPMSSKYSFRRAANSTFVPIDREPPNPVERARIEKPISMGIKSIDALLSFGQGQRIGVMAGSGVGKSVLIGMIANGSSADINVIGLIGERGREVLEFIERDLGPEGLKRSVIVCATSDQSPLMRIRAAKVTTAIAEFFADQGKHVLMMMDSVSRVAMAQREIGLAVGEPPTAKGYPPSTFSVLPKLLERSGCMQVGKGTISALYTVLVDGDDFNDPLPDTVRSILDGHFNLSRKLATKGHFPAVDVTTSTSRVMHDIVSKEHWQMATMLKALISVYNENRDFVEMGTYAPGTNPTLDAAIRLMPKIYQFLQQDIKETSNFESAYGDLKLLLKPLLASLEQDTKPQQPIKRAS